MRTLAVISTYQIFFVGRDGIPPTPIPQDNILRHNLNLFLFSGVVLRPNPETLAVQLRANSKS
jgi:hypothetical protein